MKLREDGACSRCGGEFYLRTRGEDFCKECFLEFLNIRFRRQMGTYRVNYLVEGVPTLVVNACALNINTLVLTDLLLELLSHQRQKNGGREGFTLKAVHIGDAEEAARHWPFESTVPLHVIPEQTALEQYSLNGKTLTGADLDKLPRSSRQDLRQQLFRRAAEDWAHAQSGRHSALVHSYSMSDLAQQVLAEVCKGRGAAIPDVLSPQEELLLIPLRDLLDKELQQYAELRSLSGKEKPQPSVPGITKLRSIDEIVAQYFQDIQKDFPGVVATVATTASKLSQPHEACGICGPDEGTICYACKVSLKEAAPGDLRRRNSLASVLAACEI